MVELINILQFTFWKEAWSCGTTFHGRTKCLQVIDNSFQIAGTFGKLTVSVMAACLIIEDANDQITIDTFSTTGSIFQCSLCFSQVYQGFFLLLSFNVINGLLIETHNRLDVFLYVTKYVPSEYANSSSLFPDKWIESFNYSIVICSSYYG